MQYTLIGVRFQEIVKEDENKVIGSDEIYDKDPQSRGDLAKSWYPRADFRKQFEGNDELFTKEGVLRKMSKHLL